MSDNTVNVNVTANTTELQSGMQQAPSLVQRAAEQMRAHFTKLRADTAEHMGKAAEAVSTSTGSMGGAVSGLSGAFSKVNIAFAAVAAILSGGAMFASGIKATQQFTGEANKLAKTLGITTTEASTLNVALGDIYTDADTFTGAAAMLGRQLKQNEGELQRMGLATRDSQGNLRNLNDLMMDSIKVINGYKEGTDRNLAAMTLWGRGASEATGLLKLNNEVLEAAKKKQEELGLTVGQENVEASKRYKAAMNDVGDVMLALKKAIGDAVMPILTRLGEWFAEVAPPAVFAFKVALDAVATAVHVVIGALRQLWIVVSTIADPIATLGRAIRKLIQGDVKGAQEEMTNIFSNWGDAFSKLGDRMKDDAKQTWTDITALWGKPTATAAKSGKGKTYETKPEKDKAEKDPSQMAAFEAKLEAEKVLASERDALHGMSKQAEAAFWEGILNLTTLNEKDRLHVSKKASAARVAVLQEEAQRADQIGQTQLAAWEQRNLAMVDQDAEAARNRVALGFGTQADLLAQEQEFENRRYEIKMAAAQANLAALDPARDPVQVAQLNTQIEALEQAHQMRLAQIRGQVAVESAAEMNAIWTDLSGRMSGLWDSAINAMMAGTLTWRGAFKAVGTEMVGWFANAVVGAKVKTWLAGEAAKLQATLFGTAAEKAAVLGGTAATIGAKSVEATVVVGANAAEAASGAAASQASIPIVGPLMAAAAFASIFALVMGAKGSIKSAANGYDIPAGVNPMTQLHEREMVLPAKQADVIRDLADGGGGGAAPAINIHIQALDGQSVKRVLIQNSDALGAAMRAAKRNFQL